MQTKVEKIFKGINPLRFTIFSGYKSIIISFMLSAGIFYLVRFLQNQIYQIYIAEYYLVIHTIIEFATIIMYIASFLVIFYVGERDRRLRMKVLAGVLLFVGGIDFWHTFSYDGMPGLFVESSVQSATLYWIIGRLGFAGGILFSSFISIRVKIQNIKRWIVAGIPLFLSLFLLIFISYFPDSFPVLFIEGYGLTKIKQVLEYIIIFMLIIAFVNFAKEYNRTNSEVLPLFLSALIISIFSELAFVSYFNVYDTYNLLGHIYKLIASYMIFKVLFIFNINFPYNKLDKAEREISKYANNLEQLVELRTEEINEVNQEMIRDLEYAKTIQKAIMSVKHEQYGNMEVYSEYIPYEKVGGDFYGFKDLSEEHLAFFIGDVAGHGIPAAMMTIFMNQTIVTEKIFQSGFNKIYTPKEVLINLYREYNDTDFPIEMYAVMIYGIYNKKTNNLIFSSAGLNTYPLIYKENAEVETLEHTGFPICKFNKNYLPDYKNYEVPLNNGNKVLFYTDGIIDVSNRKGEFFGEDRLIMLFREFGHLSPEKLSQEILNELREFAQGVKLNDDVHYFIMDVK
jgi:sigma-B regulation protein RsbU (phosphoserine phosphatase)